MLDKLTRYEILYSDKGPVHLHGGALVIARLLWVLIICATLSLFIIAIPARFEQLHITTPVGNEWTAQLAAYEAYLLQQMGVPIVAYAVYFIFLDSVFFAVFVLIGLVMVWRKSDQPLALFASLAMVTFGSTIPAMLRALDTPGSLFEIPVHTIQAIGWCSFFTCFFVFPDGRFMPRWTRFMPVVFIGWASVSIFVRKSNVFDWYAPLATTLLATLFAIGVAAQLYRYRQTPSPIQRQQTKMVVLGFLISTLGILTGVFSVFVFPPLLEPGIWHIIYHVIGIPIFALLVMLIPITIGLSILRYRLFDIDVLIRRTLIYGVATALLLILYVSIVIGLQFVVRFATGQNSDVVTIISTLSIAALSNPLRMRVQDTIDRRFYRRKYDAQKILAEFAATARDETDLQKLSERLIQVVAESMQPTHVSLWLRAAPKHEDRLK